MKTGKDWIKSLNLRPHPEGGYYREMLKGEEVWTGGDFDRPLYSSIYFLLDEKGPSHFHRLGADEVWYYHEGNPLKIHMIAPNGTYEEVTLGKDPDRGMVLQYCVKKGTIFGASVEKGYALVSCMVAPGFDYRDFTLFNREDLLKAYPAHEEIIKKLTPGSQDGGK